jgi:hypothetical protein
MGLILDRIQHRDTEKLVNDFSPILWGEFSLFPTVMLTGYQSSETGEKSRLGV